MAERQDHALKALLSSAQQARFRQIVIQSRGLAAFKDHEVSRVLRLSVEQRSMIRDIERKMLSQLFRQKLKQDHRNSDQHAPDGAPARHQVVSRIRQRRSTAQFLDSWEFCKRSSRVSSV